jgi:hypothetical protein
MPLPAVCSCNDELYHDCKVPHLSAMRVSPSGPWYTPYRPAMLASRACNIKQHTQAHTQAASSTHKRTRAASNTHKHVVSMCRLNATATHCLCGPRKLRMTRPSCQADIDSKKVCRPAPSLSDLIRCHSQDCLVEATACYGHC